LCKLAGRWVDAEIAIVRYVEARGAGCGISVEASLPITRNRGMAESFRSRVCDGDDNWMASIPDTFWRQFKSMPEPDPVR
jgi:hypothetical protein